MSNACGFVASSYQDLADIICDVRQELDGRLQLIADQLAATAAVADDIQTRVTTIENWVGNPGGAISVIQLLNVVRSNLGDVDSHLSTDVAGINAVLGTLGPGQLSIAASVWNALTSETVASQVNQVEADTDTLTSGVGSLQSVIGSIVSDVFGGGTSLINLASVIGSIWNAPPIDLAVRGPAVALTTDTVITVPSGVYGYALDFSVPGYWGKRTGIPLEYIPFIARVGTTGPIGTIGLDLHIVEAERILYPLPAGCHTVSVHLEPGITGNYAEMRFLGL